MTQNPSNECDHEVGELRAELERLRADIERLRQDVAQLRCNADLEFTASLLLGGHTGWPRWIGQADYETLVEQIRTVCRADDPSIDWVLTEALRTLIDAESRGLGRIAGDTANILGKLAVPRLLALPPGPVLEIGTLYGLFSSCLVRSLRHSGEERSLTVVDPLAGRQMQGREALAADPSRVPVTEPIVRLNMRELGLADSEVWVLRGLSTEDSIRSAVAEQRYAVVVVDGDHTAQGVAADLAFVETVLLPGGLVVIDDYGDQYWPGVKKATDAHLDAGNLHSIGVVATSTYLRSNL